MRIIVNSIPWFSQCLAIAINSPAAVKNERGAQLSGRPRHRLWSSRNRQPVEQRTAEALFDFPATVGNHPQLRRKLQQFVPEVWAAPGCDQRVCDCQLAFKPRS